MPNTDKKIAVIGLGYVGLPLAFEFSKKYDTIGFDINPQRIIELNTGIDITREIDPSQFNSQNSLALTNNPNQLSQCNIFIVTVPTPVDQHKLPDLSYVLAATKMVGKLIKTGDIVIYESTVYPGCTENDCVPLLETTSGLKYNTDFFCGYSPERIDPGNNSWDIGNTPRIISGLDDVTTKEAEEFYLTFTKSVITFSTPEVVEMSKLVENSFRQVNIAFVNELAQIANVFGVSINEVLSAADTKPYGYMKFTPGAGVGGHCIPVDPTYLSFEAKRLGVNSTFIERANEVNQEMPAYIVSRVLKDNNNNLVNKKIIIIGVAYKANVSDTRETPALEIINLLINEKAQVVWHDPLVDKFNNQESQEIKDQDIAVVLTLHKAIDIEQIKKIKYVFDCTNKLNWAKNL